METGYLMTKGNNLGLSDDLLAQRAGHDREAMETLLQRNIQGAFRIAFAVLGRPEEARDAAQEALLKTVRRLKAGWSGGSFKAWFSSCVHGSAVDGLRRRVTRNEQERVAVQNRAQRDSVMPSTNAQQASTVDVLREELARLPEQTARMICLHHIAGLSTGEVAEQAELSAEACKKRLARGREQLRQRLGERGVALGSVVLFGELMEHWLNQAEDWAQAGPSEPVAAGIIDSALQDGRPLQTPSPSANELQEVHARTSNAMRKSSERIQMGWDLWLSF